MINIACWVDHLSRAMLFINTSPMVCCSIWGILITSVLFRYLLCRGRIWDATDRSHFRPSKLPCGFTYRMYSIWQPYKPFIRELKINSQTLILSEVLQCIYYRMTETQNLQKRIKRYLVKLLLLEMKKCRPREMKWLPEFMSLFIFIA